MWQSFAFISQFPPSGPEDNLKYNLRLDPIPMGQWSQPSTAEGQQTGRKAF